jgi:type IV pilus assembly protein PilB
LEPPIHLAPAVASRIKIMANLDISERRLPQNGRIHVLMEGRPIDLRVSVLPMPLGEKIVIRVLDNQSVNVSLEELGFSTHIIEPLKKQIVQPNGIVLVTGPTGSGKSTTLYAALNSVATMESNVCTVEDPIEFQLPLINQFQVHERIGLTFPVVLRSLLRQGPDIVMVGEIRDEETARVAIQAALTFQHAAYQRRVQYGLAIDRHGSGRLLAGGRPEHGACPAALSSNLFEMQEGLRTVQGHATGIGSQRNRSR